MTGPDSVSALHIFAADIGATNSRFALFAAEPYRPDAPLLRLERELWLKGADFPDFPQALEALRSGSGSSLPPFLDPTQPPAIAVFAPAGPIQRDGKEENCRLPNLPWVVRSRDVRALLGIPKVRLINDFAAQAQACLSPGSVDAAPVLSGTAVPGAPTAVMGAGTGLGQALLLCEAPQGEDSQPEGRSDMLRRFGQARVLPGEGGHAEFPFVGAKEFAFAAFARDRAGTDRLIGDAIVSGTGFAHLVAYFTGKNLPPHEATAPEHQHPDAVEWFARFYGRACRNYVLNTLALGGLFVTAGMALRVPVLEHPAFAEEFRHSAAQRFLLEKVPVWHVRKPQAGLWGAALFGLLQVLKAEE